MEEATDRLLERVAEMLDTLRRNFPFYSPRYMGHMLSDVSMPSMLGYFAGMLYNANNVSTEAAPVTVDLELDACDHLIRMFGFLRPPKPLPDETFDAFRKRLPPKFGWAHTTFDGTVANLESLWVARNVKLLPLAIWEVSNALREQKKMQDFEVSQSDVRRISQVTKTDLVLFSPSQCNDLLDQYLIHFASIPEYRNHPQPPAWQELAKSQYCILSSGVGAVYAEYTPIIYASGAAHYSLAKSADLLGIGSENVRRVRTDSRFRMDLGHLTQLVTDDVKSCRSEAGKKPRPFPLAVVGICGTTEEGAIDPIHELVSFRSNLEADKDTRASFWLHVDGAWGGFLRSIFCQTYKAEIDEAYRSFKKKARIKRRDKKDRTWVSDFAAHVNAGDKDELIKKKVRELLDRAAIGYAKNEHDQLMILLDHAARLVLGSDYDKWRIDLEETRGRRRMHEARIVKEEFSSTLFGQPLPPIEIEWNDDDVIAALWAISQADSITCDPHKLGYSVYPCGAIAYADNRVRRCIKRKVPFLSAVDGVGGFFDLPARYPRPKKETGKAEAGAPQERKIVVETMGTTILEGSRPGAVACGLWLSTKVLQPVASEHGELLKGTLRTARLLYEYLKNWKEIQKSLRVLADMNVDLIPLSESPPDTNIVTFITKPIGGWSLNEVNKLTKRVYKRFSIRTELGEREHSYEQAFFLSRTTCESPNYDLSNFKPQLERYDVTRIDEEYLEKGLTVLRATVMNPYTHALKMTKVSDHVAQFIEKLVAVVEGTRNNIEVDEDED